MESFSGRFFIDDSQMASTACMHGHKQEEDQKGEYCGHDDDLGLINYRELEFVGYIYESSENVQR